MEEMDGPETPLPRRLNGRPAACDPCRARKVACDHTRPVCTRCRKRRGDTECVYTGAAPRPQASTRASRPAPRSSPREPSRREVEETPAQNGANVPRSTGYASPPIPRKSPFNRGYLGSTSYRAVFEEARDSLSLLVGPESELDRVDSGTGGGHPGVSFRDLPSPMREMCLFVLRCLPGQLNEQIAFRNDASYESNGWADIAVDRISATLTTSLAQIQQQGEEGLEALAESLCRNTSQPLRDDVPTLQDWLTQFCGANIRWESLGLLWVYAERISDALHSVRSWHIDQLPDKYSPRTISACLTYCIELSQHFTERNILLLDLCRRRSTLECNIIGEAGLPSSVSHGGAVAMMFFLGVHAQQSNASYVPTLYSENRRRLFAQMFVSDKLNVTFSGRPPFLSRRFCSTPLPLDLRDEDLASDRNTLIRAFESLDGAGWNTKGEIYPATIIRARAMIAYIRDEVVEIALSQNIDVTLDHLLVLKAREHTTHASFPKVLMYHPEELTNLGTDVRTVYIKILVHLEHLKNLFFVERLLVSHGHTNESDLLVTSFDMLTIALVFWTHRERFHYATMQRQFDWLVLAFGAPAAGILCLELLRPTFSGIHPRDSRLSRSSIIQQLSLLVAFLDWVRPETPNADLCADCKAVVQRVLDHHLNSGPDTATLAAVEPINWGFGSQPDFNFEFLDTFDWLRSDVQSL